MTRRLRQPEREDREPQAKWLVEWLNAEKGHLREQDGDKTRIKVLISRLKALSSALKADPLKGRKEEAELATCTRRYLMSPIFEVAYGPGVGGRGVIENNFLWLRGAGINEGQAIAALRELVDRRRVDPDSLERLTLCAQCGVRWIFRSRKDRQFCSEKCRQSRYEASPRRKNQRRKYMKDYYQKQLSRTHPRRKKHGTRKTR
jgi:hypothetical protein